MARVKPRPGPVEEGDVAGLTHDAEGVIRDGKTAFVHGALPGERVRYQRLRPQKSHDEAALIEVLRTSPDRVVPNCAHFGVCGGCAVQHLSVDAQRRFKQQELLDTLARVGNVVPSVALEPVAGPAWGYRRRARLGARYVNARGRSLVGFRERSSSFVAALRRCEVLVPEAGELLLALGELATSLSVRTRLPQIEVAAGDGTTVFVLRILENLTADDRDKLRAFELAHGVRLLLQRNGPDVLEPVSEAPVELWFDLPEFDVRLAFRPTDFVQVNGATNRLMVGRVVELLGLTPQSRVLDLFCGLGNFTLPIARRAASVLGIEGDAGLVERARANAAANALPNADFEKADLAGAEADATCRRLTAKGGPFTHVLLDPPRTGAWDVLPSITRLRPGTVVYVSCHPGSLARDLQWLTTEGGFELAAAGIVDMFPHTTHVESVAVLHARSEAR